MTEKSTTRPKRGRPRGDRTHNVHLRCTERQHIAWNLAAELEGRSQNDATTRALDAWAREVIEIAKTGGLDVEIDED